MSQDSDDHPNPFAAPRRAPDGDVDPPADSDDWLPEDGDTRYSLADDDFDYDPDDLVDEEESGELDTGWRDPAPVEPPTADAPVDTAWPTPEPARAEPAPPDGGGDDDDPYEDDDDWEPETPADEPDGMMAGWPLGLIAIAAVALVLLGFGGYGVMQERSALQERVRELQGQLAVAVTPDQVAMERETQRKLVERNDAMEAELANLRLENRQLNDTVAGLETQLEAQQAAKQQAPNKPEPEPEREPEPEAIDGGWFVNFGSYSERSMAESWAARLKVSSGRVVVNTTESGELFRVRVVGLPDRDSANRVAQTLQNAHGLPRLWVGEE